MAKKPQDLSNKEELALQTSLTDVELESVVQSVEEATEEENRLPSMSSPEWSDYVMRQFTDQELDQEGHPKVHGLRRVTRLLLGPILHSKVMPIQAPHFSSGTNGGGMLEPATVAYSVRLNVVRDVDVGEPYEATFEDVADCYFGNTAADYAIHPSAMASTRAEARCLRKALQIRGVASEEKSEVPTFNSGIDGKITRDQINFINILSKRNNVNAWAFMNAGKKKYESLADIPFGIAAMMVEHLSGFQNKGIVPPDLIGFKEGWENGI